MWTVNDVEPFFKELGAGGWQVGSPVCWCYWFFGTRRGKLFFAGEELSTYGFSVHPIIQDPAEDGIFWLQAVKKEILTPSTMAEKLVELEDFAADNGIFFDHFDAELEQVAIQQ